NYSEAKEDPKNNKNSNNTEVCHDQELYDLQKKDYDKKMARTIITII
ncbi:17225_t:CDS:1, partial [Acaulospora morrowiae]